jgi:hypothetical protein
VRAVTPFVGVQKLTGGEQARLPAIDPSEKHRSASDRTLMSFSP